MKNIILRLEFIFHLLMKKIENKYVKHTFTEKVLC